MREPGPARTARTPHVVLEARNAGSAFPVITLATGFAGRYVRGCDFAQLLAFDAACQAVRPTS